MQLQLIDSPHNHSVAATVHVNQNNSRTKYIYWTLRAPLIYMERKLSFFLRSGSIGGGGAVIARRCSFRELFSVSCRVSLLRQIFELIIIYYILQPSLSSSYDCAFFVWIECWRWVTLLNLDFVRRSVSMKYRRHPSTNTVLKIYNVVSRDTFFFLRFKNRINAEIIKVFSRLQHMCVVAVNRVYGMEMFRQRCIYIISRAHQSSTCRLKWIR